MNNPADGKQTPYRKLVEDRKACKLCDGHLQNASRIANGIHDSDRVGSFTQWQGNLDSPLVLVAQDFSDIAGFENYRGWAGHDVQTNINLVDLFKCAGLHIDLPEHGKPGDSLFFTNAVLCMKSGEKNGRQQSIAASCFTNCSPFLKRSIELVAPSVVVTLGTHALTATRRAFGISSDEPLSQAVGQPVPLATGIQLVPMYHPSPTVVNTHRSREVMRNDWRSLKPLLRPSA
jgi:uracil-DNA glycosylase family 4